MKKSTKAAVAAVRSVLRGELHLRASAKDAALPAEEFNLRVEAALDGADVAIGEALEEPDLAKSLYLTEGGAVFGAIMNERLVIPPRQWSYTGDSLRTALRVAHAILHPPEPAPPASRELAEDEGPPDAGD